MVFHVKVFSSSSFQGYKPSSSLSQKRGVRLASKKKALFFSPIGRVSTSWSLPNPAMSSSCLVFSKADTSVHCHWVSCLLVGEIASGLWQSSMWLPQLKLLFPYSPVVSPTRLLFPLLVDLLKKRHLQRRIFWVLFFLADNSHPSDPNTSTRWSGSYMHRMLKWSDRIFHFVWKKCCPFNPSWRPPGPVMFEAHILWSHLWLCTL